MTGSPSGLTAEQASNARAIASVAVGLGLGEQGVLVGIDVAITESTLNNIDYGDIQNGAMTSSRGLFQQLSAWVAPGTAPDPRLDPVKAATMFYTGGAAGQPGLTSIPGWQGMPVPQAAQAVQRSEFADGSNYAANLAQAQGITTALLGGQPLPAAALRGALHPGSPRRRPGVHAAGVDPERQPGPDEVRVGARRAGGAAGLAGPRLRPGRGRHRQAVDGDAGRAGAADPGRADR